MLHKLLIIASIALIIGTCGTVLTQQDDITLCGPPPPPDVTREISQGRSVLRSVTGDLGFPRAEMSEFIRDNPNWRLSHAGVAIGDFALDP